MKRSPLITIVSALQCLLGLSLAGITVYLLALTRSQETLADPEAAGTIRGLLIGALVIGIPALITLVGAWGLWTRRLWGWVLSLATDVGVLGLFVYNMVDENNRDGSEIAIAGGCLVPMAVLLLPMVRKLYWD